MLLAGFPERTALQRPCTHSTARARCHSLPVKARLRAPLLPPQPELSRPSSQPQPSSLRQQQPEPTPSSSSPIGSRGAAALAASLVVLLPLADPAAASAATGHAANSGAMYWTCLGLGTTSVVTTLLFTSRFLLSFFPGLEKRARKSPRTLLLRAVTVVDPVLDPITKGIFRQTEQGDLNYGAMALLAVLSAVLTVLLGHDGVLVDQVPDLSMLAYLQYLIYFQHMQLLPMWVFVVFRYFLLI